MCLLFFNAVEDKLGIKKDLFFDKYNVVLEVHTFIYKTDFGI